MTVHILISGGANELVGEIVCKALENAGIGVGFWANCEEEEAQDNISAAEANDQRIAITALKDE